MKWFERDMLIAVDDPSFTYFIGLCLLRRQRDRLLLADSEKIPEIVMQMNFNGEEEIDSVIVEAVSLHKNTPRSVGRTLSQAIFSYLSLLVLFIFIAMIIVINNKIQSLYFYFLFF